MYLYGLIYICPYILQMWHENNLNRNENTHDGKSQNVSLVSNQKKIKVCIHLQYPYAYRKKTHNLTQIESDKIDGFYYEMWKVISNEIQLNSKGKWNIEEYFIEEEALKEKSEISNHHLNVNDYDIVVGLYNSHNFPYIKNKWTFSDPIFIRDFTIITKRVNRMNELFIHMFLKKYVPIVLVFIVVSIILGNILYTFTPRKNRKNAIWHMFSGMMGEFGYLSEKLSDHYNKTTWFSYVVNIIMLMICLYCFIYIQATINTTMIYSKNKIQRSGTFINTPHKMNIGYISDMKLEIEKFIEQTTNFKLKEIPMSYEDAVDEYLIKPRDNEPKIPKKTVSDIKDGKQVDNIDGILVDNIKYRHEKYIKPDKENAVVMIDTTFGKHPISLAIKNQGVLSSTETMVDTVNTAIRELHRRGGLQNTCDYYMKENAKQHCI